MARDEGSIELEIVTPTGFALRETVDGLTAPSVAGEFGVLPGHLPVLAALRVGIVRYQKRGEERRCAVGTGFVEVVHDRALLLTDRYATAQDVDIVRVQQRLKEVDHELDAWTGELADPRRQKLIDEEQWLAALIELYGYAPPPTVREDLAYLAPHAEAAAPDEGVDRELPPPTA